MMICTDRNSAHKPETIPLLYMTTRRVGCLTCWIGESCRNARLQTSALLVACWLNAGRNQKGITLSSFRAVKKIIKNNDCSPLAFMWLKNGTCICESELFFLYFRTYCGTFCNRNTFSFDRRHSGRK